MNKHHIGITTIFFICIIVLLINLQMVWWQTLSCSMLITLLYLFTWITELQQKRTQTQFIETILTTIDLAIQQDFSTFSINEEALESKIQFKIKRLFSIYQAWIDDAQTHKTNLQKLITDISHQVKTPLSNIKIYSDLLQRQDITSDDKKEFIANLNEQIDKLEFFLQSMIKTSRLENDIIQLQCKAHSLYETVAHCVGDVFYKAMDKNITITISGDKQIQAQYDEGWCREAIDNILDNGIKYSNANTSISITLAKNEFYAKLAIKDQGKGIEKAYHNAIFQRFFRVPSEQAVEGIGVGLFLTREIITKQYGYITVDSSLAQGACFTIYLPLND